MFFRDVIGQNELKQSLIQSVKEGRIPHARLISGLSGTGKIILALAYARYLNCLNPGETDSCGECPSCIKYNKLVHPDLHFVFPIVKNDKKKKEICDDYLSEWREFVLNTSYFDLQGWLNFIGAENAQGMIYAKESNEIIRKLNLKAYESEFKIMLIWLPEKMHDACANKLLKIIEEPLGNTVFLLVSESPEMVIETIQSRAQSLPVPPIRDADLKNALKERFALQEEELNEIVHLSRGSYLKAIEIIETGEEKEEFLGLFIDIMRNCWTRNVKNMKEKAEVFASLGRERQKAFLAYAQGLIRENFIIPLQLPEINYLNRAEANFSKNFSPYVNERNVVELMEELALAEKHIESNVNPRMVFFDLSMKIAVLLKK
jgi:DNA polymerase III, gamma/tau subunits